MVTRREDWLRVLRPLALLALFAAVIRGLPGATPSSGSETDCLFAPAEAPADMPTLERCLEMHPEDVELLIDLGRAHEAAGQWDRAEALFQRAVEIDPEDGDARVLLGEALLRRGDAAGAAREGAAALKMQPGGQAAQRLVQRSRSAGAEASP